MRPVSLLVLAVALAGCDRAREPAAPVAGAKTEAAPSLVGTWRTEQPARYAGEDVRTETRDGRTVYRPDGRFAYTGRLVVHGEKLPADGLPFRMRGEGEWRAANRILTERFTALEVAPEGENRTLARLGQQIAADVVARPPTEADIMVIDQFHMRLRDRDSGEVATYARE